MSTTTDMAPAPWEALPRLTLAQRSSINIAETLGTVFVRLSMMERQEIVDTIGVLQIYAPHESDTVAEREAFALILEALITLRDDHEGS